MNRKGNVLITALILITVTLFLLGMIAMQRSEGEKSAGNLKRTQEVETVAMSAVSYVVAKLGQNSLTCSPSPCSSGSSIVLPNFGDVKVSGKVLQKFTAGGDDYYLIEITAEKKDAKRTVEFLYRK